MHIIIHSIKCISWLLFINSVGYYLSNKKEGQKIFCHFLQPFRPSEFTEMKNISVVILDRFEQASTAISQENFFPGMNSEKDLGGNFIRIAAKDLFLTSVVPQ